MTTVSNGAEDTHDEGRWLPFGIEDEEVAAFTALREDIPPWLDQSLWEWVEDNVLAQGARGPMVVRTELLRKAERVLRVTLPVIPSHRASNALTELMIAYQGKPAKTVLALVDFLASELEPGDLRLDHLEHLLVEAGSGWHVGTRAGKPGLVKRLPAGVRSAAAAASQHPNAGKNLATAFESAFGVQPDPSKAYAFAVKAVEDAAIPVVPTSKAEPTLGDVIRAVESGTWRLPHLREHSLAPSHDVPQ